MKQKIIFISAIIIFTTGIFFFNNSKEDSSKKNEALGLSENLEMITFAGGCFWCIESAFQEEPGVTHAVSGYVGGRPENANYLAVSKGGTLHRESVQVTFDPLIISAYDLIKIFWNQIDPTDNEGQFSDRGFQYTTAIYYHSEGQKKKAEDSLVALGESNIFELEIVTKIVPISEFYSAEEYHQDYYKKSSRNYKAYAKASGRVDFIEEEWAKKAAQEFLQKERQSEVEFSSLVKGNYDYSDEEIELLLENLDPLAYHVVAENGTEQAFNNTYWNNKADGIYTDIVTGNALFSSTHKYDSGTGWPAFWRSINDDSIELLEDNSLSQVRTEVRSETGHLGHVFDDGPVDQGGRRFCINSASLLFIPLDEMKEKGYGEYLDLF
jgi:peptide methionine sulfoxide reductase msrA/msrB